ncbi:hypothetical protein AALP_AA7G267000 [Arabis alpina]|uniref:F-box domain-containing protein n=1 Tax=Arabis alpina TaxID=50452 RepID=A0A087GKT2_ARAAL|nr:hypothetical protein AALP_AA7G267000 [Arabis alpina]
MSLIRSPKKQQQPPPEEEEEEEPPSPISFLPEEIFIDIIARVPRSYHHTLSQVSKRFRSLVTSPELYERRSFFGNVEQCLYVAISKDQTSDIHWFTLSRKGNENRLVHVSSLPPMPLHGSYVSIGSNIFVIGGFCDWKITSSVTLIDCRSHVAQSLPDMPKAVAYSVTEVIDKKIYVIGGSDTRRSPMKSPSRSLMVFDTEIVSWKLKMRPDWELGKRWFSSVVIDGKIYMRTYYNSFVYDPRDKSCDRDEVLHSKEWCNACVIDDVLYYYDVKGKCIRGYDPKVRVWGVVKGLDGLLPEGCCWSNAVSYNDGKMALFLQKDEIWCAEITVEKREGGEIWGKVEWCDVVLGGNFHIMGCVAVTV